MFETEMAAEIDRLKAEKAELLGALRSAPLTDHPADERGKCLCSWCEFSRAARAAIAKAEKGQP